MVKGSAEFCNGDKRMVGWLVQVLSLMYDLRDPYTYSMDRCLSLLIRFLGLVLQFNGYMESQFLGLEDLTMALMVYGVPRDLLQRVEALLKYTSKKALSSELLIDFFLSVVNTIADLLVFLGDKFHVDIFNQAADSIRQWFSFLTVHSIVKKIVGILSFFYKNQQCLIDPQFRTRVHTLHESFKHNYEIVVKLRDPTNKYVSSLYSDFLSLVKTCDNYGTSSRMEPVCIVFEGGAGTGKSTFMNKLVYLLNKAGKSVYCHTVPSVDGGKDFYDDYSNQDVFVMDDVGQQGVSQWRTIINFVAPVKFPLECAAADKKNTKFFSSELILCTTNHFQDLQAFTKSDCIAEPEALYRRVHLLKFVREGEGVKIKYFKYDYMKSKQWVNGEIPPYTGLGIISDFGDSKDVNTFKKVYEMIVKLLSLQKSFEQNNNTAFSEDECDYILGNVYEDARAQSISMDWLFNCLKGVGHTMLDFVEGENGKVITGIIGSAFVGYLLVSMFLSYFKEEAPKEFLEGDIDSCLLAINRWEELMKTQFQSESLDHVSKFSKFFKFFEVFTYYNGEPLVEYTQGLVSGRRVLLPNHIVGDKTVVNVYDNWECFKSKVIMLNLIRVKVLLRLQHLDLCVCEFENLPLVPFKVGTWIASEPESNVKINYFVNCHGAVPLVFGVNMAKNSNAIRSLTMKGDVYFPSNSGFTHPISAKGLCGSAIIGDDSKLVGFHVAGNSDCGFAVAIPKQVRELLTPNLDVQVTIHNSQPESNFSGARIEYDQIPNIRVPDQSHFIPSELNGTNFGEDYEVKKPAELSKYGSGKETLKAVSSKSFTPISYIKDDELQFVSKCVDALLLDFTDITEKEVVLGDGQYLSKLNKDSANGLFYDSDKLKYIDFTNGKYTPEFSTMITDLKERIENDKIKLCDVLAKETLKDELRKIGKDPRSFRILPLHHLVLCKEVMGDLFRKVRKNMWFNGIAIGMNPYKDWNKLYAMLTSENKKVFAVDFGKWDGSCHAQLQDLINDCVRRRYKGKQMAVLNFVLDTIVRSYVAVGSKVFLTTHSIPSGAWTTAFFNSLINRALTALCYYRNTIKVGGQPSVSEYLRIVDFVLGDDKVCAVPDTLQDRVNAFTLSETAASLGMTVTDCHKNPITTPFHSIGQVTFLKRGFVLHPELGLVGPLEKDTLFNTIQWFDGTKEYDVTMQGKSIALQIEGYLHGYGFLHNLKNLMKDYSWYVEFDPEKIRELFQNPDDLYSDVLSKLGKYNFIRDE